VFASSLLAQYDGCTKYSTRIFDSKLIPVGGMSAQINFGEYGSNKNND
jgi:hypothetical protein